MNAVLRLACLLLLPAALAACGKEEKSDKARAGGEILPGSASDAMLPLDTVRSQPPLAPRPTESGAGGKAAEADGEAAADAAADATAAATDAAVAPTPSASPSPDAE